jgi:dTMP kinase
LGTRGSGVFVVIEGPEGAGKSTLVKWLVARLAAEAMPVTAVREPGGTPIAEAARKLALKSRHDRAFGAELFLFLAARADLVERVIRPALADGHIVIADRFGLSTLAYQVSGRGLPQADVEAALRVATGGLTPELTLVLDVPVAVGRERQRTAGKVRDRIEREDDAFHTRVRDAYRRASGPGIVHIDGSQTKQAVHEAAWREVAAVTGGGGALSMRGV